MLLLSCVLLLPSWHGSVPLTLVAWTLFTYTSLSTFGSIKEFIIQSRIRQVYLMIWDLSLSIQSSDILFWSIFIWNLHVLGLIFTLIIITSFFFAELLINPDNSISESHYPGWHNPLTHSEQLPQAETVIRTWVSPSNLTVLLTSKHDWISTALSLIYSSYECLACSWFRVKRNLGVVILRLRLRAGLWPLFTVQ